MSSALELRIRLQFSQCSCYLTILAGVEFIMEWKKRTLMISIPWDHRTDTARFYTAPNTRQYRAYAGEFDKRNDTVRRVTVCYDATVLSDGKSDDNDGD
jgi:hypothetical protein